MELDSSSDLCAADTFDSQNKSCGGSLSPLSEPPDIGKWFSSYVYESPELDSSDEIGVIICKDDQVVDIIKNAEVSRQGGMDGVEVGGAMKRKLLEMNHDNGSSELAQLSNYQEWIQPRDNVNSGSEDLLSLASEPPDIRNWFSSYVYESPVLDTSEGLGTSIFKEMQHDQQDTSTKSRSGEKADYVTYKATTENKMHIHQTSVVGELADLSRPLESQDHTNSSHADSLSLLSEPPEIRNWFTRFVYEALALHKDADSQVSIVPETQTEQQDIGNEKRTAEQENCDISKNLRNKMGVHGEGVLSDSIEWSGEYESPALHVDVDSELTEVPETQSEQQEVPIVIPGSQSEQQEVLIVVPDTQSEKQAIDTEERNDELVTPNIKKRCSLKNKLSILAEDALKDPMQCSSQAKSEIHHGSKCMEIDSQDGACFPGLSDQIADETPEECADGIEISNIINIAEPMPSKNKIVSGRNEVSQHRRLFHRKAYIVKLSSPRLSVGDESDSPKPAFSVSKMVSPMDALGKNSNPCQSVIPCERVETPVKEITKENEPADAAVNGFISTRKKLTESESSKLSLKRREVPTDQDHLRSNRNSTRNAKAVSAKTTALSDVTNTQHSTELQVSGKWSCPLKKKPNLGPPMKQLRIEQWITRV